MMTRFVAHCCVVLVFCCASTVSNGKDADAWPVNRDFRRPIELAGSTMFGEKRSASVEAVVRFQSGGRTIGDGNDVLVVDGRGNVLPSKVVFSQRFGESWVAYDGREAQDGVWLYYGGSTVRPGGLKPYNPQMSLTLVTAPLVRGAMTDPRTIARAVESSRAFGMTFVDNVYLGRNPIGPNEQFVSHFRGILTVPRGGEYVIYTNSDEASFVFIDDKPVVAWPGTHGPAQHAGEERRATVELEAGPHVVDYFHAEDTGTQVMVLGWEPPDGRAEPIPPSAFEHRPVAVVGPPQRRDGKPYCVFDALQVDQLLHDEHQYTRFRFETFADGLPESGAVAWDFGDGVTRTTHKSGPVEHVFVGDGPFDVTMRITDGKRSLDECRIRVRPVEPLRNATIRDNEVVREYVASIVSETYSKAVPNALMEVYWGLVQTREQSAFVLPFVRQLGERTGMRQSAWEVNDRLAHGMTILDPKRAFDLYTNLIRTAASEIDRARMRMEQIEVVLHKLDDPGRALTLAKSVAMSQRSSLDGRIAAVKIGDVHRAEGRIKEAEAAYREAAQARLEQLDRRQAAVLQTAYLETVSAHIERGDLRAAREEIVKWEADFPLGKLDGEVILVTARYFQALGDHDRVVDELTTLTELNPLTPHLPEVELRLAVSMNELGRHDTARELRDHVVKEYPNSRAARWATRLRIDGDDPPRLVSGEGDSDEPGMFDKDGPKEDDTIAGSEEQPRYDSTGSKVDNKYEYEDIFRD